MAKAASDRPMGATQRSNGCVVKRFMSSSPFVNVCGAWPL
jgi:hypothetical protein